MGHRARACGEIVNAAADDDNERENKAKLKLHSVLDELETRYGALPSILATRADYVDDLHLQETLLLRAYSEAKSRSDARNMVWVASSLAALYAEELQDYGSARRWIDALRANLVLYPDDRESEELNRLKTLVENKS
jgi:hypothetical protein